MKGKWVLFGKAEGEGERNMALLYLFVLTEKGERQGSRNKIPFPGS